MVICVVIHKSSVMYTSSLGFPWGMIYGILGQIFDNFVVQSRVSSPEDIYDTLSVNSTFMSYIGEYTFTGSTTNSPAFSIVTPNKKIPNLEDVTGLEVVIHDTGIVSRKDYLTSPTDALITYQIYLILWDSGTGDELTNATKIIIESFSNARSVITVPINKTANVAVQSTIEIPNNAVILV